MTRRRTVVLAALLTGLVASCGGGDDIIIKTSDGRGLTAADIDREPLSLLPAGAVLVGTLDAPKLFASPVGARLLTLLQRRLPVPASVGYEPARDLSRLYLGLYSFQGVDFAGVANGNINPQAIEEAANGTQQTPLGSPLVRVEYAGRVFYVSANVGFVVLTEHTVVFGNQTGIRRVLDRGDPLLITPPAPPASPSTDRTSERSGAGART